MEPVPLRDLPQAVYREEERHGVGPLGRQSVAFGQPDRIHPPLRRSPPVLSALSDFRSCVKS